MMLSDGSPRSFTRLVLRESSLVRFYGIVGGISLLMLVFLIPPFQVPDEPQHFFRSYQLSTLELWSRVQDGAAGADLPASLPELVDHFMVNGLHEHVLPMRTLVETLGSLRRPLDARQTAFVPF